jgi:hypothetical protein
MRPMALDFAFWVAPVEGHVKVNGPGHGDVGPGIAGGVTTRGMVQQLEKKEQ